WSCRASACRRRPPRSLRSSDRKDARARSWAEASYETPHLSSSSSAEGEAVVAGGQLQRRQQAGRAVAAKELKPAVGGARDQVGFAVTVPVGGDQHFAQRIDGDSGRLSREESTCSVSGIDRQNSCAILRDEVVVSVVGEVMRRTSVGDRPTD